MKKILLTVFIFLFTALNVHGSELKIAYVDLNRALNESEQGKKATTVLEEMVNSKKTVLVEKEKELKNRDDDLKKQSSVLSPEALKTKTDEFNRLYKDYQRMVKDFQEEIQKKEEELRTNILKDLKEIINKIGKDEDYSIIFEVGISNILYSQEKLDITDSVIKKYNETAKAKR